MDRNSAARSLCKLIICCGLWMSCVDAVRVQTIAEAREEARNRDQRAVGAAITPVIGGGVFGNESMIFNSSCILMETLGIKISVQELKKSKKSLDSIITSNQTTLTYEGSCMMEDSGNDTAEITVTFKSTVSNGTDGSFRMIFGRDRFNWFLSNLTLSASYWDEIKNSRDTVVDVPLDTKELFATRGTSYYCNNQAPFRVNQNDTQYSLYFLDLIMEPFLNDTAAGFDPVESCEYAFSIGVWMGIVTALIMIVIVGFGISMLASIRNMDRFDDPKTSKLLSVPNE